MADFNSLNPEDLDRDHHSFQDELEHRERLLEKRRYADFNEHWTARVDLTPSERALLHGFRLIDNALDSTEENAA